MGQPPWPSPTGDRSAPRWIAMVCVRPATSSPMTTWSSWPPRPGPCPLPKAALSRNGGSSPARCSSSTLSRAASSMTRKSSHSWPTPAPIVSGSTACASSWTHCPRQARPTSSLQTHQSRCSTCSRRLAGPRRTSSSFLSLWRPLARRRSDPWAMTPRSRCYPARLNRSTTISANSLPR